LSTDISVILRNNNTISLEEFKILDSYSYTGKILTLLQKPTTDHTYIFRHKTIEYIFDYESLTVFKIISQNILAHWPAEITRNLGPKDEFYIGDNLWITYYIK
jgi:hypothetical protein